MRRFLSALACSCLASPGLAGVSVDLTFTQTGPFYSCDATNTYYVVDLSAVQGLASDLNGMFSDVHDIVVASISELSDAEDSIDSALSLLDDASSSLDSYMLDHDPDPDLDSIVFMIDSSKSYLNSALGPLLDVRTNLEEIEDVLSTPQPLSVDGQVLAYACSPDSGSGDGEGHGSCPCPPYIQAVRDYLETAVVPLLRNINTHLNNIYNSVYVMETHMASWTPLFNNWASYFSDWHSKYSAWNSYFSTWNSHFRTWNSYFSNIDDNLGYLSDELIWFVEGDGYQPVYTFGELVQLLQLVQAGENVRFLYPYGWQFYGTNQTSILDNIRDINSKLPFPINIPSFFNVAVTNDLKVAVTNEIRVSFTNEVDLDLFENFYTSFNESNFDSAGWSNMRLFFMDYYDDSVFWESATHVSVTNLTFDGYASLNWFEKVACMLWSINAYVSEVSQAVTGGINQDQMQSAADSAQTKIEGLRDDVQSSSSTLFGHMTRFKTSLAKYTQNNGSRTIKLWDDFQPFPSASKSGEGNTSITIPAAVIDLDSNEVYTGLRSVVRSVFQVFWSFILGLAMVACHWYIICFAFSVIMWAWRSAAEMKPVAFKFFGVWSIGDGYEV